MNQLTGRTAIVTGGGSGIGAGIAESLAARGIAVMVADIDETRAAEVARRITAQGGTASFIGIDVSDAASVEKAGRDVERRFGRLHFAFNNAGVALHGTPLEQIPLEDWQWVIGVNIMGVVHGIRTFVPMLREHGEPGRIVNTASIGGLQVNAGWMTAAYSMTKYAVVALSEGLRNELKGTAIGVSVLCPAAVRTQIAESAHQRPERFGGPYERPQQAFMADAIAEGWPPRRVGERVIQGMLDDEFMIFTHSSPRPWIEARHAMIQAAFEKAAEFEAADSVVASSRP
ncbi:MAG: SDR family NAD(P)-dependent oxidoreductase [Betaproteobacteria bacterium]|nr:SDR family NAD(P)-dependent oxidoreductase [Betaproteobacteria bacterium]